ncbi:MAG: hypothetical protein QNJ16_12470 [Rhodobacter sp.]|nr:hypothetical protein [Rhodobacter sp.]
MKTNQKLVTALVTIVAATATAHLMQRNGAEAARIGTPPADIQAASLLPGANPPDADTATPEPVRQPENFTVAAADLPGPAAEVVEPAVAPGAPLPTEAMATPDAAVETPADAETAAAPEPVAPVSDETETAAGTATAKPEPEPAVEVTPEPVILAAVTEAAPAAPRTSLAPVPDMPRPPADALAPAPLPETGIGLAKRMASTAEPAAAPAAVEPDAKRNEFGLTCGVILSAAEKPGGMVNLMLTAPCRGDEPITVRHDDLAFTARTNHLGTFAALIPALTREAAFTVAFADGTDSETQLNVPSADAVDRVVLQTAGETGLQIHALEFGAGYDTAGHVWAGQPRDPAAALNTGGGFITQLGDPSLDDAQMAEVYTFPADARTRDGVVRLSVETEVTAYNCGKEVGGRTLQRQADGSIKAVTLTLSMPDCDAIGEFLVLKNLLQDLKIAAN